MPSTYQLFLDGTAADDALYVAMGPIEVEESLDLPGAIQLSLPVNRSAEGDLTHAADARFRPMAGVAVVVTAGRAAHCIFDGYVLSHRLHLRTGVTDSTLQVWGQDASWLMNREEKVREWVDVTDADVAGAIFAEYGIDPAPANADDDSPAHAEHGHTLMQRGSDIQFLRGLARRNGKHCRVACADRPGRRTGYFARPDLGGEPAAVFRLNDPVEWNVDALDLHWDVTRPTAVVARQALFTDADEDGVGGDADASGLDPMDARGPADFAGGPMTVLLTAPVNEAGELAMRARSLLREAGWFVRCEGEADASRLGAVLRAGTVVRLDGVGSLHSGRYLLWSVRHTITREAHRMKFVLVRNAVGPPPPGGGGGLGGLLGGF